jgi:LuxR family maltose regulon positive regulatory protein
VEQLIATKLFIPPTRPGLIHRPRLIDRLNICTYPGCKLVLISAPAGFGKTTLVSEWVQTMGKAAPPIAIAWISLDDGDNDPARFLAYFIAALNQAQGGEAAIGIGSLSMLQSPQPPPAEVVLTPLVNEIANIPDRIILVLDDYHVIESSQVDDTLSFLLDYLPPQMHLVIATREDPHLPLSRLRARGQMTELRAADLRFTSTEAAEFLNRVMGLELSVDDIASLETRTEGWIAGLQLAAISMQGNKDATSLIKAFTGSHKLVQDFLIEEVLSQQSERIQKFLLQTSILDQLTGPICDALTHQNNSQSILESLERANLFIIPQDDEMRCFRYHHLFADLLRLRLEQTQPEQLSVLHSQASKWYEENGLADEAIAHALRAEDFERAAYLIEQHVDTVWAHGEYNKLRRWLAGLPDELVFSRPQLCIFQAWELFASGQLNVADRFLQAAERAYDSNTDQAAETEPQRRNQPSGSSRLRVRGRAAAIQAWMDAYRRHNISGLIQHLRQALEYLPDEDLHWRGAVATTLGDVHAFNGDMPAAYQARLEALKACEAAGNTYHFMYNSAKLALNLKAQGRLLQVKELCQQRVRFANENGMSQTAVVGWLLAIWGEILTEINDLDGALDLGVKSLKLTERGGDVVMLGWSCLSLTRVLFSKGDLTGAEEIVQKMDKIARESIVPTWIMNLNAAWQSRIWLAQDKLEAAAQWVRERGLGPDEEPTHVSGFEYIAFVRILIARGRGDETIELLQRMLDAAGAGGDTTRVIEVSLLQALAFQAGGDTTQAMDALKQALTLAEPEGFVRIFVDEGQPMARLLYKALDRGIAPDYVARLLQAFPGDEPGQIDPQETQSSKSGYIEPLSEREIEVIQLIAEGLTNQEIANRLILSLYTVKTHTRNIYSKLGVNSRTQAVTKARALGIFSTT